MQPLQKGSTPKGKNLLLREQILFFKSWTRMRLEAKVKTKELLPLKVNPFTLRGDSMQRTPRRPGNQKEYLKSCLFSEKMADNLKDVS